MTRKPTCSAAVFSLLLMLCTGLGHAQESKWPREVTLESGLLTIYQPQMDTLKNDVLAFRAAVSFKANGSPEPVFGAAWFESRVEIDRVERTVHMLSLRVVDTRFPNGTGHIEAEFDRVVKEALPNRNLDFSLDDLLTSLEAAEEQIAAANDLNMEPPTIIYRDQPALLILLDGDPVLREIESSPYKAVINTPYPLILDTKSNTYYLNAGKSVWYQAEAATGPFSFVANPPSEIATMVDQSEMEDSDETVTSANAPELVVSTEPAELIVTEGEAQFEPLVDDLLVISNSASDIFMHVSEQDYYIVLSGRWFKASSMRGPWAFVKSDALPEAFQDIPEDSNQAESRAYIAGTDEAREAVMDSQIPQTAAVQKGRADLDVTYDGEPRFVAIAGVSLKYAENTGFTVIQSGSQYFVVEDAVWYVSNSPKGPWDVAESRPDDVDSIPPESPVYNVKYVYIYETTPEVVYVGYTPGYTGSYVYHTTVVYGTGWYYRPWVTPYYYYPRQATWGFHVTYNPWTGWGFGLSWGWGPFRVGFHSGGYWHHGRGWYRGHHGRWGAGGYRHRPGHFGNINNPRIGQRDNNLYRDKAQRANVRNTRDTPMNRDTRDRIASRDGASNRNQLDRSNVSQRPTTRDVATTRNNTPTLSQSTKQNNVFTDKQGNVYRKTGDGWQQRDSGSWKNATGGAGNLNTRPTTRPTTQPSTRPTTNNRSNTNWGSTRQSSAYQSSRSGYNRSSSLDRQSYSRQRSSARTQQYSRQRSSGGMRRGGGRRR